MSRYFRMSSQDKARYLDEQIRRMEQMLRQRQQQDRPGSARHGWLGRAAASPLVWVAR